MVVRLAFAVIANTEPHILIVDEALAVGDAKFQARCLKRIRQLKEQGVTILFVSHDSSSVKILCQRAALMNHGKILEAGNPKDVVNHYIALLTSNQTQEEAASINSVTSDIDFINNVAEKKLHRHGNKLAVIDYVKLTDLNNQEIKEKLETGSIFNIVVCLEAKTELSDLVIGFSIRSLMGVVIYGTNTYLMDIQLPKLSQGQQILACFQIPCYLNKGVYTVTIGIHSEEGISYDWIDEVMVLEVSNSETCEGLMAISPQIKVNKLQSKLL
jgi:lipopolysaccharide transport system ATP-binding protein